MKLNQEQIDALIQKTAQNGPTRVVTKASKRSGIQATGPMMARDVTWDVVLIRDDGWSLACKEKDLPLAKALWEGSWVVMVRVAQVTILA